MDEEPRVSESLVEPRDSTPFTSAMSLIRQLRTGIGRTATQANIRTKQILASPLALSPVESPIIRRLKRSGDALRLKVKSDSQPPPSQIIEELEAVVARANEVLATATTIFPLSLFTDTVTLDRTKLTITRRTFFFSSDIMSIRVEDILNVSASIGLISSTLTIVTRVMSSDDHFVIKNFSRRDVLRLKHIIQGYVIALHNNIHCDHLSRDDLIKTLSDLGADSSH